MYDGLIWIPDDDTLRLRILRDHHDAQAAGHPGRARTLELVSRSFYWPGQRKHIHRYVDHIDTCHHIKPIRHTPFRLLKPLELPHRPWDAISMLADGICHPWSGLHMEPISYPDEGQPIEASMRVGSTRWWEGLHAIQQANSCLGAVRRDDRRFMLTEFLDDHAYSAKTNSPIAQAVLGMVSWEHKSVTQFLASICTRSFFDRAFQMQRTFSGLFGYSAAMSLQREYCEYRSNSWVVARTRSSGEGHAGWLQQVKHLLMDLWNESWVQPEATHDDQAVPGSQRKREGSFCDGAAMHKKGRV